MTNLNDPQREQALFGLSPDRPVPIVDEQTQKVYYLISADQFEKVRALLVEEEFDPAAENVPSDFKDGRRDWLAGSDHGRVRPLR